ncbi:pyridoxine/pyridoxamine 5'-phosphate oxidase [Brachybacterium hainanense]|uniref:Pyridoxal 5'-phosphate synthase n=1 Tax=Brachybacterium hainanense TaxID=1541174 RepID=A0ABV6RED1_9MICO
MSIRDLLRSLPALTGTAPGPLPTSPPVRAEDLFRAWLEEAIAAGVPEPHAMTVATLGEDGVPDARVLILKDVDARGWAFASTASSTKGRQLAAAPTAALTFWWPALLRSVRVRGPVREADAGETAADLAARSPAAREGVAPGDWRLWRVVPDTVEFWQGREDRRHERLVYDRDGARLLG